MKTIDPSTTEINIKQHRSKIFYDAFKFCNTEEMQRVNKEIAQSKHFEGWKNYAKYANEFISINGKLYWTYLDKDCNNLEILHRYSPISSDIISSTDVCFITEGINKLIGLIDSKNRLLKFVNNTKNRNHFSKRGILVSPELAKDLGFHISSLTVTVN